MNPVYLRLAAYVIAPMLAASGFGALDPETMVLTINLKQAGSALVAATASALVIFKSWGTK